VDGWTWSCTAPTKRGGAPGASGSAGQQAGCFRQGGQTTSGNNATPRARCPVVPLPSRYHRTPAWPHHRRELRCMQGAGPKRDRDLTSIGAGRADADLADGGPRCRRVQTGLLNLSTTQRPADRWRNAGPLRQMTGRKAHQTTRPIASVSSGPSENVAQGKLQRQMELPSCSSSFD
jgi:hypothetical protein